MGLQPCILKHYAIWTLAIIDAHTLTVQYFKMFLRRRAMLDARFSHL